MDSRDLDSVRREALMHVECDTLRRQLAAANERVAELAELWKIVKDEALDEYAVTLPHVAMAVSAIDRILGGGK